jgi:hypothetical protein
LRQDPKKNSSTWGHEDTAQQTGTRLFVFLQLDFSRLSMSVSFVAVCLWCFTNSVLISAKPKEPFPLGLMKRHPFQFVGAGIAGILVAPQQQVVLRFAICCAADDAAMYFFWFVLPVCEILKELLRLLCGSPGCSFDCF